MAGGELTAGQGLVEEVVLVLLELVYSKQHFRNPGPGGNGIGSPTIPWLPTGLGENSYIGGGGGGGGNRPRSQVLVAMVVLVVVVMVGGNPSQPSPTQPYCGK